MGDNELKNSEVYEKLTKVKGKDFETKIPDEKDLSYKPILSDFASFLSDKEDLASNEKLNTLIPENGNYDNFNRREIDNLKHYDFNFKNIFVGDEGKNEFNNNFMFLGMNCAYRENLKNHGWAMFHDNGNSHETNMLKLRLLINGVNAKGSYITDAIKGFETSKSAEVLKYFFVTNPDYSFNESKITDEQRALKIRQWNYRTKRAKETKILGNKKLDQRNDSNGDLTSDEKEEIRKAVDVKFPKLRAEQLEIKENDSELKLIKNNRNIYENSIRILIHELDVIYPKQVVVFGISSKEDGKSNTELVQMIAKSPLFEKYNHDNSFNHDHNLMELQNLLVNAVSVNHYSDQHSGSVGKFYSERKNAIENAMSKKNTI